MLKRLMAVPLMALLGIAGVFLIQGAFERLREMRMIERIPRVTVSALIPGEANLGGRAEPHQGNLLRAPDSGAPCLVYHYTVERRTRDSDGDTKWETITSERRHVPFRLADGTGAVLVDPETGPDGERTLRLSLASLHSRTAGDLRYNESRLDPGMTVFAMGLADDGPGGLRIRFEGPGDYVPILSVRGEEQERGTTGLFSLLLTALGLLGLSLAMLAFTRAAGIHFTLAYLLLVALTVASALTLQANRMIRDDLRGAFARLAREQAARHGLVASLLEAQRVPWDGDWDSLTALLETRPLPMSDAAARAVSAHRVNLMRAMLRAERIRRRFPERLVAQERDFVPSRISGIAAGILTGLGTVLALLLGGLGLRRIRTKRWIENIPTVKTRGVVYGLNEVKGTVAMADGQEPLAGPLSGAPCSCYHYVVREKRRNGRKTEWVTITDEKRQKPFLCRDADGALPIQPDKAEIIMKARTRKSKGRLRHEERRLPVGAPLYALGCAVVNTRTHDSLVMARGDDPQLPFLLSDYRETELVARKAGAGFLLLAFGLNAFSLAALSLAGYKGGFGVVATQSSALAPLLYMMLFFIGVLYNDLVFLRRRADAMWANIDVALKKRFDLVPALASAAGAYVGHERTVQQALAQLRGAGAPLAPGEAQAMVAAEAAARRTLAGAVEAYPDLKADATVKDLMRRTRDLEDEVALMREGYNHAVEVYNTRLARFPEVLLAKGLGFRRREFFREPSGGGPS